jgi:putative spermidine/putrescine transport system substrate-binding protein
MGNEDFTRRDFLAAAAATLASVSLPAMSQTAGASIVANWYPGLLGTNLKRAFLDTFPGRELVQSIEMYDNPRFTQMQANRAKPTSDIAVFIDVLLPLIVRSGLLTKLDAKTTPNLEKVDSSLRIWDDFAVPFAYGAWGICYNAKRVQKPITSWKDLLRDDLKGHVTAPNVTFNSSIYTLDAMARVAGGSLSQASEGMKAIRQIRVSGPGLWEQENIAVGWLKTEEVWLTPYYSGSVLALKQDKDVPELRFVIPTEGAYLVPFNIAKVANAPNPEGANRLINHMLGAQSQSVWASNLLGRGTNRDVTVPKEVADTVPLHTNLRKVDWQYFAENRTAVVNQWNEVVNR